MDHEGVGRVLHEASVALLALLKRVDRGFERRLADLELFFTTRLRDAQGHHALERPVANDVDQDAEDARSEEGETEHRPVASGAFGLQRRDAEPCEERHANDGHEPPRVEEEASCGDDDEDQVCGLLDVLQDVRVVEHVRDHDECEDRPHDVGMGGPEDAVPIREVCREEQGGGDQVRQRDLHRVFRRDRRGQIDDREEAEETGDHAGREPKAFVDVLVERGPERLLRSPGGRHAGKVALDGLNT